MPSCEPEVAKVQELRSDVERPLSMTERMENECPSRWVEPMWSPAANAHVLELAQELSERENSQRPWALLLDDGDLEDVNRMLEGMGTPTLRLRQGVPSPGLAPRRLLVVSGSRALSFERLPVTAEERAVTVALLSQPSKTLARRIANMGFDYVLQRPVHPDALRLLLQDALHGSFDRRAERRFPVGWQVKYRIGWRRRSATLAELSRWGCSLSLDAAPEPRGQIKVCLPSELTGGASLALYASLVRSERRPGRGAGAIVSALFDKDAKTRARLGPVLAKLRHGPPSLPR